jgi:hypothetical protein
MRESGNDKTDKYAASVGGLFHFKPTCDVAFWYLADNPTAPAFVRIRG